MIKFLYVYMVVIAAFVEKNVYFPFNYVAEKLGHMFVVAKSDFVLVLSRLK